MPRLVRGVTVNTHFLLERIRAVVPASRPVILVPNGVDLADFEPPEPERVRALRAQLGLAERPAVIYVGSLSLVNHPVDLLLKGFAEKVLPRVPQAVLLIAGGGPDLEALQAQAAILGESVRFLGRIPHAEILCYYAAADLSIDPVLADETAAARSPLKLYESLAVGTPVLTGAVGDRCDLLQACPSMLVPAGDASALGLRIAHLLLDEPRRAAAQAWAREQQPQFLWESRIDTFVKVYDG
jgi:glycosyltransferase involved in cell wall biosynthesis